MSYVTGSISTAAMPKFIQTSLTKEHNNQKVLINPNAILYIEQNPKNIGETFIRLTDGKTFGAVGNYESIADKLEKQNLNVFA